MMGNKWKVDQCAPKKEWNGQEEIVVIIKGNKNWKKKIIAIITIVMMHERYFYCKKME